MKAETATPRPDVTPGIQNIANVVDASSSSFISSGRREQDLSRREVFAVTLMAGILSNQKLLENLDETITPAKWAVYQAESLRKVFPENKVLILDRGRELDIVRPEPRAGWISVDDRRPEWGQVVAFIVDGSRFAGSVFAGRATASAVFFKVPGGAIIRGTHWLPLPTLPAPVDASSPSEHDILGGMT
jgi:hypothetical protein